MYIGTPYGEIIVLTNNPMIVLMYNSEEFLKQELHND